MREQDIGAIPVGENDRLVGIVSDRDIILRAVANGNDISAVTAGEVMTKGIVWSRESDEITRVAQICSQNRFAGCPTSIRTSAWSEY
jgi:CBS domain-containing protein